MILIFRNCMTFIFQNCISLAAPNACNPVNPTTPQPFSGNYETCADQHRDSGSCFAIGPNGNDPLQKGGYCQFPHFLVDFCSNTCGYCSDPPVKLDTPQGNVTYLKLDLKIMYSQTISNLPKV